MDAPEYLGDAGRSAWLRALDVVPDDAVDTYIDLIERYARAVDMSARLRDDWEKDGRTTVVTGNGMIRPHPLIAAIRDADHDAHKYGVALGLDLTKKRPTGRPPGAASAPDRAAEPPRARSKA